MLKKIYILKYEMKLNSGVHIGGSNDVFDIGGADSTVIKNPLDNQPYIPGSSIKGKIRSVLTSKYGKLKTNARGKQTLAFENENLQKIFGGEDVSVSRAIFRDALLSEASLKQLENRLGYGVYTEIKAENKINPLNGKADSPRFIERIPAGVSLEGEIVLNVMEEDNEAALKDFLKEGILLLENNYIGGSGTRGYGRVEMICSDFEEVKF